MTERVTVVHAYNIKTAISISDQIYDLHDNNLNNDLYKMQFDTIKVSKNNMN